MVYRAALLASLALLGGCCAQASARSTVPARRAALADERSASRPDQPLRVGRGALPSGRTIAGLGNRECRQLLRESAVRFDNVQGAPRAIAEPLSLHSPLLGVRFEAAPGMPQTNALDCRLAVALLAWAPILRDAGVVRVEHFSTFRPGARVRKTGKVSGHAHALAIDAARFHLADGRVLEVLDDWDERERGGDPCPVRRSEDERGRILRQVVCRAVERDLFQVVITPHHDRDHQNHVHLELVPNVDWSYVR